MTRLALFIRRQRHAWSELFRPAPELHLSPPPEPSHPAALCRCNGVEIDHHSASHSDHQPDCPWLAAMCQTCSGTGWCERCGGDGCEPGEAGP